MVVNWFEAKFLPSPTFISYQRLFNARAKKSFQVRVLNFGLAIEATHSGFSCSSNICWLTVKRITSQ
jgi:hypothetical protein